MVAVALVALVCRVWALVANGGLAATYGYDQSVYYTAAVAVLHGRAPYLGEFIFVHPPGVILVGLPFAALGSLLEDHTAFLAMSMAFLAMGVATSVLVVRAARLWGAARGAALAAGLFYAAWIGSVASEYSIRLEVVGNLLFVVALIVLARGLEGSTRALVWSGLVLGLLVNVKLWWALPALAVVLLAALLTRQRRVALLPIAAMAAVAVVVDLPLLVLSRGQMFTSVVSAQLSRTQVQWTPGGGFVHLPAAERFDAMTGVRGGAAAFLPADAIAGSGWVRLATLLVGALVLVVVAAALRHRWGRVFVVVLLLQVLALLRTPVYYEYYGTYLGVTFALVLAAAATRAAQQRTAVHRAGVAAWAGVVLAVGSLVAVLVARGVPASGPTSYAALAAATADTRCVVADDPSLLIRLDALDRSFAQGCRNVVDFQGIAHGAGPQRAAHAVGPTATPAYRAFVHRYLVSGQAVVMPDYYIAVRLGPARMRRLGSGTLLGTAGPVVLRSSTPVR